MVSNSLDGDAGQAGRAEARRRKAEANARIAIERRRAEASSASLDQHRHIRELADHAAHDLKSIVRHIGIFTSILEDGDAKSGAVDREILAKIHDRTAQLRDMITTVRDLAVAVAGALEKQRCDVAELVGEAGQSAGFSSDGGEACPQLSIEGGALIVGDRALLRRAFQYILENAVRHSGVESALKVAVVISSGVDAVTVRVEDNGCGVNSDIADGFFEPFIGGAIGQEPPSLGLGLTACRSVAEAHGGSAEFVPRQSGAALEIKLPLGGI